MHHLEKSIEKRYGQMVDVVVVDQHPYDTNLMKFVPGRTHFGGWASPIDWFTGARSTIRGWEIGALNTIIGVGQVGWEYITGGSSETYKAYEFICEDLTNNPGSSVILLGHSGGGAVAANLSGKLEENLGVDVRGVGFMGSPVANQDYALQYAENVLDIRHKDDLPSLAMGFGQLRSNESRYSITELITDPIKNIPRAALAFLLDPSFRDANVNVTQITTNEPVSGIFSWLEAHGTYWQSDTLVSSIDSLLN